MASCSYDVCGIGNAIVDVLFKCDDAFLEAHGIAKGAMTLIDTERATFLYNQMKPQTEMSGGSAANTMAGLASLGGKTVYLGKVADDSLGDLFERDLKALSVSFDTPHLMGGDPTARCMVFVTPDAQRSMNTFLGASACFEEADVDASEVQAAEITYLEGFLFDRPPAQAAFMKAADLAHKAGRKVAMTLSDVFCVERHHEAFHNLVNKQVDILFANESELCAMYHTKKLAEAVASARLDCSLVVTTRGAEGVLILTPLEVIEVPAQKDVTLVDTTGAGDLFAAGFMFGLTHGKNLADCGRIGNAAAAEVISHFGPRPQISLKEILPA